MRPFDVELPTPADLVKQTPAIRRWLIKSGVAPNDAEDIAAEVIGSAWLAIERGRYQPDPGKPKRFALFGWLLGITWRQRSTSLTRAYRRREVPTAPASMPRGAAVNPEPRLLAASELTLLQKLDPERREVLLSHASGEGIPEIAARTGVHDSTTWSRLRQGRVDLSAALRREAARTRG